MDELFIEKVRSAVRAGWWTVLIATCFLLLQWVVYHFIISRQPEWMLYFWGEGITWDDIQSIWLWAMGVFKLGVWFMILAVVWLTIWARLLTKKYIVDGGKK